MGHLLLKTANAFYVAKSANSGFEASGMRDMVAAWVLWRRVGAACAPHTSARRSACAAAAINTHSNIPRQCHVTRSAAVPRVFPRVSVAREGDRGQKVCELFTMCCTAGLGAKEVRRDEERRRREEGDTACARAPCPPPSTVAEYALALRAGVGVYCCAPHSRRCNHAVALLAVDEAYGWVQNAVTRQCSHVPDESFARHSHAHHAVLAVPPLQLYRHNIARRKKCIRRDSVALQLSVDKNRVILKEP